MVSVRFGYSSYVCQVDDLFLLQKVDVVLQLVRVWNVGSDVDCVLLSFVQIVLIFSNLKLCFILNVIQRFKLG